MPMHSQIVLQFIIPHKNCGKRNILFKNGGRIFGYLGLKFT